MLARNQIVLSLVTLHGCADLLPAKQCRVRLNTASRRSAIVDTTLFRRH